MVGLHRRDHGIDGAALARMLGGGPSAVEVAELRIAGGGFAPAQASLGQWLKERKQWEESVRWYRRSAEQGDPGPQNNFGLAYYRGRGVGRDRLRAFEFTARYAHLATDSVKASGSRVGDSIGMHIAPSGRA